jgi:general secretion pathway protein L
VSETLILILGDDPTAPVSWGLYSSGRLRRAGRTPDVASLRDAVVLETEEARVVAVIPGEQAAARILQSPPRDQAKLRAAARYLLEDELAQSIDAVHVVTFATEDKCTAYAMSNSLLEQWLSAIDATGLRVTGVTPDFACLGTFEDEIAIAAIEDRIIFRDGSVGFSAEASLAAAVLPKVVQPDASTPVVYGSIAAVGGMVDFPLKQEPLPEKASRIRLFAERLVEPDKAPNFLSGAFKRKIISNLPLAPLKRPLVLAAVFAAVFCAVFLAAAFRDARIAGKFEDAARAMHETAFPSYAGGDIRDHVRTVLASSGEAASFLEINSQLSAALEEIENVAVDRIRYDASRRQFFFNVRSSSDSEIEALRLALEGRGVTAVDNGGYRRSGDAWIGEMAVNAQ